MPVNDWHILDGLASRRVNGQEVRIKAGNFPSLQTAIEDWEAKEKLRQDRDLRELGRLVDTAMARLQTRHGSASDGASTLNTSDLV